MTRVISISSIVIAALGILLFSTLAHANEWSELTYFTFSAPVELPGLALPAGTYMFKLLDSASDRHVVQVFNQDGQTIYGTFLTVPDQQPTPSDEPTVVFKETPVGTPEAIKAWFYQGESIGDEFMYPGGLATQRAAASH
jgi:hypothetical protein